ncbi:MAG TPA: hypothetical protein DD490_04600 [Acidobacteria bacterium]|nr:hypothetical protein [Acidobacteriota bacterium]
MSDNRETALERMEEIYRRWDAVRARSSRDEASAGGAVSRLAGFVGRTVRRIRDLGISWDLQRDLFRALLDRVAELDSRLTAGEAALAQLQAGEADIRAALDAMWKLHAAYDAGSAFDLRERHEILRVRQARLEGALADLREEMAALRGEGTPTLPLTPRDVAEILAAVEQGPGEAGAVEVSFQDVRAEPLLLAARRHFGGRLAAAGPSYRAPNDLWVHVDFTAAWNRPILLDNAAARLAPEGRFVLVTAPATGALPEHPGLVLEEDRVVALAGGGAVRVVGWRTTRKGP